jgi:hypothetical protein
VPHKHATRSECAKLNEEIKWSGNNLILQKHQQQLLADTKKEQRFLSTIILIYLSIY